MKNKNIVFLFKNLNCLFLKTNSISSLYIYNNKYFFYLCNINFKTYYFNKNINALILNTKDKNNYNIINNIFFELTNFYYKKIIFNGKGFKLKKNKNANMLNFNNSHIKLFLEQKNKLIKNSKNSFLYLYKNIKNIKNVNFFLNLFKINIFTKRGVKLNRSLLLIKKTKKK
jgi:hypothetical protein